MQPPSPERIWSAAQQLLRTILNQDIYNLWFSSLTCKSLAGDEIILEVANDFCEVWLKDNYLGLLRDVLGQVTGQHMKITFTVAPQRPEKAPNGEPKPPVDSRDPEEEAPAHAPIQKDRDQIFNPKNTFETFVVGSNNTFAHAAAFAVSQSPGKSYNPLFLYGGVGLGKTHLLHAIGQHVTSQKRPGRVTYVSTEKFTNDFIDAIQNNQLMRFRKRYRQTDVFLIDDIQFLAGKERIQEEFFHTFNSLHEAHKQIVLTCDRPASEIEGLEQRLVSRFEWGLVTDMQPPDVETRVAILRKKEKFMNVSLPQEIHEFIAARIRSNVRRLEGALVRVASYQSLTGQQLNIETVEKLLGEVLKEEGRVQITIDGIQKRVAEHFDMRLSDMTSKRRPYHIAFPRQIAMYLSRQMTESSLNTIGEAFGNRDHGTVLHACRLVKDRMQIDAQVRQTVNYLEKQLLR